jgi:alkylation response protein AidB-like acyl-CoA dehydrogenase
MQLDGARGLARTAAWHLDHGAGAQARALAAAALVCARREGVSAAHRCHQLFGAIGITVDGPAWFASRRIRQLASLPPGCAEEREALLQHFGL